MDIYEYTSRGDNGYHLTMMEHDVLSTTQSDREEGMEGYTKE